MKRMKNFMNNIFNSFVYYSNKFNRWGGRAEDHAVIVLLALTYILQVSFLFFLVIVFQFGLSIFRERYVYILISIILIVTDYLFWFYVKKKCIEKGNYRAINYKKYYWGSLLFVFILFLFFLFSPIYFKTRGF